jgi:hypothetical protein
VLSSERRRLPLDRRDRSPERRILSSKRCVLSPKQRVLSPEARAHSHDPAVCSPFRRADITDPATVSPTPTEVHPRRAGHSPIRRRLSGGRRTDSPVRRNLPPIPGLFPPSVGKSSRTAPDAFRRPAIIIPGRRNLSPGPRQLSPTRRRLPAISSALPPPRRRPSPTRRRLPRTSRKLPQTPRKLPQTPRELPQDSAKASPRLGGGFPSMGDRFRSRDANLPGLGCHSRSAHRDPDAFYDSFPGFSARRRFTAVARTRSRHARLESAARGTRRLSVIRVDSRVSQRAGARARRFVARSSAKRVAAHARVARHRSKPSRTIEYSCGTMIGPRGTTRRIAAGIFSSPAVRSLTAR